MQSVRLIGPGRAGLSLAQALTRVGFEVRGLLGRDDDHTDAASGVDVLVISTPDDAVAAVAAGVRPAHGCVVVHLAASLGLDVLGPHLRRASLHPLVPLPNPEVGTQRLLSGIAFAVAGDRVAGAMARALGGRPFTVADVDRPAYHAAACVAANHVVALLGQVERIAASAGLSLDAFLDLSRAALDDVTRLGPHAALTGPAARGDWATLEQHRRALAEEERPAYAACAALAHRLAAEDGPARRAGESAPELVAAAAVTRVAAGAVKVVHAQGALHRALDAARAKGATVGLVPTMGALHAGHESLVRRAAQECDVVAVSIFVNPLQFGDAADLDRYPRTMAADLAACAALGVSVVFAPSVTDMYPDWPEPPSTVVSVGPVASGFEGASRPGHFDGVATVVAKLFALAGRCRAYFGEKDFQQLLVVRRLATDLGFPVEIVGCPTVREPDGLALSSRNARLGPAERAAAGVLWRALGAAGAAGAAGERRCNELSALMDSVVATEPLVSLDYAAVVDAEDLSTSPVLDGRRPLRLLMAAQVGPVRLIDNAPLEVARRQSRRTPAPVLVGAGRPG